MFCTNLFIGLVLSQAIPEWIETETYYTYKSVVKVVTMFHLSYIVEQGVVATRRAPL